MKAILYDWGGLNVWLFTLINSIHGPAYDKFMVFITQLGAHSNFKYFFLFALVWLAGELGLQKMRGEVIGREELVTAVALLITLVMSYAACGFLTGILKTVFAMPRPFMLPELRAGMHFAGPAPAAADYYASFPSGHAATIGFIVAAMWRHFNQPIMHYIGIALVFLVCWSRVALGMHFPADVLAGVLIGVIIASLVQRYVYRMVHMRRVPVQRVPVQRR